jgi:molybdopterin/thiamine biosynthesis adenylyltransferase
MTEASAAFSYVEAFERNLGLVTREEQERLGRSVAAIAGCGGVGGLHAHTLARLGVGGFRLADADTFSVANFNRQIGATTESIGKDKTEVTAAMIRSINPDARITVVPGRVSRENADDFVRGAGVVVDGVDYFSLHARRRLYAAARRAGIPVLMAAPLGFGATLHVFGPRGMSFDEYFDLRDGQSTFDQLINFSLGLAPAGLHVRYMDYRTVNVETGRGPSSIVGTQMAACLVGAESVRILLGRGPSREAPEYLQFDAYRRILKTGRLPRGNRGFVQRLKKMVFVRRARSLGWDKAVAAGAAAEE